MTELSFGLHNAGPEMKERNQAKFKLTDILNKFLRSPVHKDTIYHIPKF